MNDPREPASILLVDDERDILDALSEQLSWEGYEVTTCQTANEALALLEQKMFNVVISDQRMPGMTGLELMGEVRRLRPNISRVLITGVLSMDTVIGAINEGEIFRFLAKPWMRAELLATVENAVQRHRLLESNEHLVRNTETLNRKLANANAQLQLQIAELTTQREQLDQAHEALSTNFEHSLGLCYRIINTFDPRLGKKTKAVVDLCRQMAEQSDFTPQERHVLVTAAWLHDIGLIGIQRDLLAQLMTDPESCSAQDRAIYHDHPIYGQTLAAFVDRLSLVGETIRAHHERFDGLGYPDGLMGNSIPWTGRCLAVAVAYVECGLPREQALELIRQHSGKAFDPAAVRVFFNLSHRSEIPRQVREIPVSDLRPGMQLARGIYSPTGILLIAEGQPLTPATVEKLQATGKFSKGDHLPISRLYVYR